MLDDPKRQEYLNQLANPKGHGKNKEKAFIAFTETYEKGITNDDIQMLAKASYRKLFAKDADGSQGISYNSALRDVQDQFLNSIGDSWK